MSLFHANVQIGFLRFLSKVLRVDDPWSYASVTPFVFNLCVATEVNVPWRGDAVGPVQFAKIPILGASSFRRPGHDTSCHVIHKVPLSQRPNICFRVETSLSLALLGHVSS